MPQDKLSEEVRKQYEGLGENGSPPSNPTELQPNDPDVGQSEEDEAKPLLERLTALEVNTFTTFFYFLPPELRSLYLPLPLFVLLLHSSSSVCQLSESFVQIVSASMTAHQILQCLESEVIL